MTGLVGIVVVTVLVVGALQFPKLPLIHNHATYQADFANAGGLASGDIVTVDGKHDWAAQPVQRHSRPIRPVRQPFVYTLSPPCYIIC